MLTVSSASDLVAMRLFHQFGRPLPVDQILRFFNTTSWCIITPRVMAVRILTPYVLIPFGSLSFGLDLQPDVQSCVSSIGCRRNTQGSDVQNYCDERLELFYLTIQFNILLESQDGFSSSFLLKPSTTELLYEASDGIFWLSDMDE